MKAISVQQPHAHAVAHLGKRVENLDWRLDGPHVAQARRLVGQTIAIHAAATYKVGEFHRATGAILDVIANHEAAVDRLAYLDESEDGERTWRPVPSLPFGAVVAVARLVEVVVTTPGGHRRALGEACRLCGASPELPEDMGRSERRCPSADPWAIPGTVGLVLGDVRPVEPVKAKGRLGFFEVDAGAIKVVGEGRASGEEK